MQLTQYWRRGGKLWWLTGEMWRGKCRCNRWLVWPLTHDQSSLLHQSIPGHQRALFLFGAVVLLRNSHNVILPFHYVDLSQWERGGTVGVLCGKFTYWIWCCTVVMTLRQHDRTTNPQSADVATFRWLRNHRLLIFAQSHLPSCRSKNNNTTCIIL